MSKRKQSATPVKPSKPRPDFPLFPHATGRWAKKVRGTLHYFGPWRDPQKALDKWLAQKEDLLAGRKPKRADDNALTVAKLVNAFLDAKQRKLDAGELKLKTFCDYHETGVRLSKLLGRERRIDDLQPTDFGELRAAIAKTRGPIALGNEIQRVRTVFKFGYDSGLIDAPLRMGPEFVKPPRKVIRLARSRTSARMIEAADCRNLIDAAGIQMRAMILLALNCGVGNTDVAHLPSASVDLRAAIIDFPRPKTGIERRAPLWPETVKAIEAAIAARPEPRKPEHDGLLFLTRFGQPWLLVRPPIRYTCHGCDQKFRIEDAAPRSNREMRCPHCSTLQKKRPAAITTDSVKLEFGKLLDAAGLSKRGRGFYALRHTFRTVADEEGDRPAIDRIMGHENSGDMRVAYVERIDDRRLRVVTNHVRKWLYGKRRASR